MISNAVMFVAGVMIIWCSFDVAGRDWVKLKKYQKSLKNQASVSISGHRVYGNPDLELSGHSTLQKEHQQNSSQSPDDKGRNRVRMAYKRSGSNPSRSWRHR